MYISDVKVRELIYICDKNVKEHMNTQRQKCNRVNVHSIHSVCFCFNSGPVFGPIPNGQKYIFLSNVHKSSQLKV